MGKTAHLQTSDDTAAPGRDLEGLVGYQLRRVGAEVVKELSRIFSAVDLAPGQFSILMLIAEHSGCFQMDLARLANVDRSTLVPMIERLARLKFIKRSQSDTDRRAFHLQVTARGRKAIDEVMPGLGDFEQTLTNAMSAREKTALLRSLRHVEEALLRRQGTE